LDWEDIYGPGDIARGLLNHSSGIMAVPGVIHYDQVEKVTPALVLKMLTLSKNFSENKNIPFGGDDYFSEIFR
ncbi:MAG: hypothetical protein K6T65_16190, partial [Peptococcaceae bacterium]|nr:hypothetical protein [Peptococcaceae bacterium]